MAKIIFSSLNYCNHNTVKDMLVTGTVHDFFIISSQKYLQSDWSRGAKFHIAFYQLPKVVETKQVKNIKKETSEYFWVSKDISNSKM